VGSGYLVDPTGSPWTFTGSSGIAGNGSPVTSGNPVAPQGTQVAWAQNNGSISQTVNFAAGTYTISFDAAQRGNYPSSSTIQVKIDGQTVGSITPTGTSYALYTTNSFTVTAGNHTVAFVSVSNNGGSTALLDAVSIQSGNQSPPPAPPPSPPPGSVTQPNDPGFELPNVGNGYQMDPTGSPWTFTGSAGVAGNGSAVTSGNPAAPQGTQVAWMQNAGTISQAVNFGAGSFTVSFEAAQRGNFPSNSTIQVQIDVQTVGSVTPTGTSYAAFTTNSFTVTAGSHTVQFVGVGVGGSTALLDQVSIQSGSSSPPPAPPPSPPPGSVTQPNDPGFELPSVGSGWAQDPTGSPWTFAGAAGVAGNGSAVTSGNPNAPQGTQVAWAQNGGSISQAVNFSAGNFTISLEAAQRGNYPSNSSIQVQIDGQTIATVTPSGTSYSAFTTTSFTVTAGSHTIKFVGVGVGGSTALLDQVSIAAA
jgi:hypothetical protein